MPPLTFHTGGRLSAKRHFFVSHAVCLSGFLAPVPSHLFLKDSALSSCNIGDEGALHALGERVNRLCVRVVNKSASVPSVSLECSVLTQKSDSPLSVGRVHRGGQCGEIPKISFPEAGTNKRQRKGWRETLSFCMHTCALFPSAPGVAHVQDHQGCCCSDLLDHHPRPAVCSTTPASHIRV